MKKLKSIAVIGLFLSLSNISFADEKTAATGQPSNNMQLLQNQVFQLQSTQDSIQKQFDAVHQQIQKIQSQISQLNGNFEKQLQQVQTNNDKTMKQLQQGYEKNLQDLNGKITSLNERLAKMPAKSS